MAALKPIGYGALTFVNDYMLLVVVISEYIVARNRMTTVGYHKVLLQILIGQTQGSLAIDGVECGDIILFFALFLLLLFVEEEERETTLVVAKQCLFILFAKSYCAIADSC